MLYDTKKLKTFPELPGVYLMKNGAGKVLYVGKAKNLKMRVKQYFVVGGDGRQMIPFLIPKVEEIDTIVVRSEKEALLLENTLIKEHKPKYNALLKDDKTYIALKIGREEWPKLSIIRYRGKPKADGQYFGPYTSSYAARQTYDLLNKMFPFRQCSDMEFARRTRPCILYDMKRCIAPCVSKCTKEEYDVLIKRVSNFLKGNDKEILKELYEEMHRHSEQLEFEKAGEVLQTIRMLEKTIEKQNVDNPMGGDADVLGIFREAEEVVLSQLFVRGGKLTGSQNYNFSQIAESDAELYESFIIQHYTEKESLPHEILVPVKLPAMEVLSGLVSADRPRKVVISTPSKGSKRQMLGIAMANAEASYKKDKDQDAIREQTLLSMQEKLKLSKIPRRIECFDNSNLSGELPVSTLVTFTDGKRDPSKYRKYNVKSAAADDDYGIMKEILTRRFKRGKEEMDLPDLLIVDGGKGHLNVAVKVLAELNIINVDVIGVAKDEGRHDKGITSEQVFLPNVKDPIRFNFNAPTLFLLQQIRDEAHRTAITFHKKKRSHTMMKSRLDDIQGIGPTKKKNLLKHFGSLKNIAKADFDDLRKVKGISEENAKEILKSLQK